MSRAVLGSLLAIGWLLLILAAPTMAAGVPASAFAYGLGALICHQRPERSFHLMGAQLPVCARCTGIYAGAALGSCLAAVRVMALRFSAAKRGSLNPRLVRMLLFAAAAPTAITWLVEVLGLARLDNLARAAAAVPFGISVAWLATVAGAGPTADASLR